MAGLLVATLGGCAHYYWTKPDTTAAQFDRDSRECVQEARGKLTAGPAPGTGVDAIESMYRYCLSTRGYARVKQIEPAPPGSYRGLEDEGEFVRALGRS